MLTPVGKRILVKPVEVKRNNIIVLLQKPIQFIIHAIGDEITKVKVGDTIYFEEQYGAIIEIEHEEEKYLIIDERLILAKVINNE